jgi:Uma2 family endonuclease
VIERGVVPFTAMQRSSFVVDPADPRAPSQEEWERMSEEERRRVVASLPTDMPRAEPPEGDAHRVPKTRALESLAEYYRRIRRRIYLSAELPVYYPGEAMFAPDLIAVLDVEAHERPSWIVSHEGRGLDLALEIHVAGDARKDFEDNVVRYARLGIPEYFAFDAPKHRLVGWRLPEPSARRYERIVPQAGRWPSGVLGLDLAVEEGRLRFFHGSAPLLDASELIERLSVMVDDAVQRAEAEAQRAEAEARRAEAEARRAERLAQKLKELGVDPDEIE